MRLSAMSSRQQNMASVSQPGHKYIGICNADQEAPSEEFIETSVEWVDRAVFLCLVAIGFHSWVLHVF